MSASPNDAPSSTPDNFFQMIPLVSKLLRSSSFIYLQFLNITPMRLTLVVSNEEISRAARLQLRNMAPISVTLEVSKLERSRGAPPSSP